MALAKADCASLRALPNSPASSAALASRVSSLADGSWGFASSTAPARSNVWEMLSHSAWFLAVRSRISSLRMSSWDLRLALACLDRKTRSSMISNTNAPAAETTRVAVSGFRYHPALSSKSAPGKLSPERAAFRSGIKARTPDSKASMISQGKALWAPVAALWASEGMTGAEFIASFRLDERRWVDQSQCR
jgi:hypothetical protein